MKWLLFDLVSIQKIIKFYRIHFFYLEKIMDVHSDISLLNKKIEFQRLKENYENKNKI
jgi:hypothetical protein